MSDAREQMRVLLGGVFAQLTVPELEWCLTRATVDGDVCPFVAAAEAAWLLGGRAKAGVVSKFTADGATFEKTQDWQGWGDWLNSRSPRNTGDGWDVGFAFLVV